MMQSKKKTSGRIVYITAVMVLAVMAAIVVLTSQNRAKKKTPPADAGTTAPSVTEKKVTEAPKHETEPPTTKASVPVTEEPAAEPVDAPPASLVMPTHGSLSKRHDSETLVYSLTMGDYRTHTGIDIAAAVGSPVYSAGGGTVKEIWVDPMMGNCISVEHSGGMVTVYKNLSPDLPAGIAAGVPVGEGEIIGAVGETALVESADESHLHFEVLLDGKETNPVDYLASFTSAEVDE